MQKDEKYPLALPAGTVLGGQYVIQQVLGQGGFGITYRAVDHKTGNNVAVKEFFPDSLATRTGTKVEAFTGERGDSFNYGKTCFLQEAETLAKFTENQNIVRIHAYFEENGTAYFTMDYVEGISFEQYIKNHGGKVSYGEAEKILIPIIDALAAVHSKGIVHRDVTPDNIFITKDGTVKLLDFGAARYSLGDKSRSLDVVLKHGFAPKEQYTRRGKQGPFTDIYTVGASFYFAITGKRPPDSIDRLEEDELIPPSSRGVDITKEQEDAILMALNVQPQDRFQSMLAFRNALLQISTQNPVAHEPVRIDFTQMNIPNTGIQNTGMQNTGMQYANIQNTGMQNTGMQYANIQNTGFQNTGIQNTGIQNTGIQNTGIQNTGIQNTGVQNVGTSQSIDASGTAQNKPAKKKKGNIVFFTLTGLIVAALAVLIVLDVTKESQAEVPAKVYDVEEVMFEGNSWNLLKVIRNVPVDYQTYVCLGNDCYYADERGNIKVIRDYETAESGSEESLIDTGVWSGSGTCSKLMTDGNYLYGVFAVPAYGEAPVEEDGLSGSLRSGENTFFQYDLKNGQLVQIVELSAEQGWDEIQPSSACVCNQKLYFVYHRGETSHIGRLVFHADSASCSVDNIHEEIGDKISGLYTEPETSQEGMAEIRILYADKSYKTIFD